MPQNAHIVAIAGDYTTIIAWEAAEQGSNYGAITVGQVDGFFSQGTSILNVSGTWVNGGRLEPFNSADAFDGTERQLCGLTSSNNTRTVRGQISTLEIDGLEIYNTGGAPGRPVEANAAATTTITNALLKTSNNIIGQNIDADNCVLVTTKTTTTVDVFQGTSTTLDSTVFAQTTADVGAALTATNTVSVNIGTGADFSGTATQANNASTDTSADTLTSIVVATEFLDSDPVTNGDYRIASGSSLDANGIGAFIQASGGGISIEADSGAYTLNGTAAPLVSSFNATASNGSYNLTGAEVTLIYTPVAGSTLAIDSGVFALTGTTQELRADRKTSLGIASYSIAGTITPIKYNANVHLDSGVFGYNGTNINLITDYGIIAETAEYVLLGSAVVLRYSGDALQTIGVVTSGFAPDTITSEYKQNSIKVTFKG